MAYKQDPIGAFGDYQKMEYPNMKGLSTQDIARLAQKGAKLPTGLGGYVRAPMDFGDIEVGMDQAVNLAAKGMINKPAGLQGVEDDAFLGYDVNFGSVVSPVTSSDEEDEDEDEDEDELDGLGGNSGQDMESWHANFHKASLAKTETALIKALAKAVAAVPDNTPMEVRKQYYDLAKAMIVRRKQTDLRHADVQRIEIESNIGWLVDPRVPKSGGFNKMLEQAVGKLGPVLARDTKTEQKVERQMKLGQQLVSTLKKAGNLAGFGEGGSNTRKIVLMVGVGIAAVALYHYIKNRPAVGLKKNKKR